MPQEEAGQNLTFLMGKFQAVLPADRRYARNHMWCQPVEPLEPASAKPQAAPRFRFGFTAYAVRLMQDVYFLDWHFGAGASVESRQEIGHIETSKAVADLFAPIKGVLVSFNTELLNDPSPINLDNYGSAWLFEMEGQTDDLMSPAEYRQFLEQSWEKTQNSLKGHMQ